MATDVRSELISRNDLGQMLLSSWQVNERLASQLPREIIEVYRSGFRSAISAIATAYQIDIPALEYVDVQESTPEPKRSRYDMRF